MGERIREILPLQRRYSRGGFSVGEAPCFSNACGGAGRFWAAFRGNSVGRSSETRKTDI